MEKIKHFFKHLAAFIIAIVIFLLATVFIWTVGFGFKLPSFSWWSSTFFSDNYSRSIITEVEASGQNIRAVQFVDAFGRVCTSVYASVGTGLSCDYPPEDKRGLVIEDYKKALKK